MQKLPEVQLGLIESNLVTSLGSNRTNSETVSQHLVSSLAD
jgi:hypothetical protein